MAKSDEGAETEADDTVADGESAGAGGKSKAAGAPAKGDAPGGDGSGPYDFPVWLRFVIFLVCAGVIIAVGRWADPGDNKEVDRIMFWTFIVFSVGIAELFLLFIGLGIFGLVDLTTIFQDKADGTRTKGGLSLARLQAFLWTLIVLVTYFHEAVTDSQPGLPTIPSELILVMGISGATYLASKQIAKPGDSQ